jgi:hypothetical protein
MCHKLFKQSCPDWRNKRCKRDTYIVLLSLLPYAERRNKLAPLSSRLLAWLRLILNGEVLRTIPLFSVFVFLVLAVHEWVMRVVRQFGLRMSDFELTLVKT